jgi:hypothetical protein
MALMARVCAEVVYTTLAVLVEIAVRDSLICRSFDQERRFAPENDRFHSFTDATLCSEGFREKQRHGRRFR